MKNVKVLTTMEEVRSFTDPYRIVIMKQYLKMNRPATVKQIADEMGDVPAKVHYHVKKMIAAGLLKLDHTKEINGILAKYYEPTARTFQIENKEIGLFLFSNDTLDLNPLQKVTPAKTEKIEKIDSVMDAVCLLSEDELVEVMAYVKNHAKISALKMKKTHSKKYHISIVHAE